MRRRFRTRVVVAATAASLLAGVSAQAGMTLTPAAQAAGYGLTTFASGFPSTATASSGYAGPLGIAFPTTGGVLVSDFPGNVRLFATHVDNQTVASAPSLHSFGTANSLGLIQVAGTIYMAQEIAGQIVTIDPATGAILAVVAKLPTATGLTVNPSNGHLLASDQTTGIFDINPANGVVTKLNSFAVDGLSDDGTTVYAAQASTSHILGFSIATGQEVFDSGYIAGGVDGTALGSGNLAGELFVNTNGGTVVEINLATQAQTLIGTGGSRGDFVTVDPTNDTLLLTQSDSILRLTAPDGSGFGPPPPPPPSAVPLPAAACQGLVMLGLGAVVVGTRRLAQHRIAH